MVLLFVKYNFLFNLLCCRVFFVASVPGSHRGPESDKWGHRRLGHLLKKHATIPSLLSPSESNESWPVIAQCSSIGTLGAGPDAWMCGELRTSMSQRALLPGDLPQPPPKFNVVSHFEDIILLGCDTLSLGESFFFSTFICPCIANIIPNYYQQDATFLNVFISTDALHVSGGSSAHHQEHTTVCTASGIVNQYAATMDEMELFHLIHYSSKQEY